MKKNSTMWKNKPVNEIFIRDLVTTYDEDAKVIYLNVSYHVKGFPEKELRYRDVLPMSKGRTHMKFTTNIEWENYVTSLLIAMHNTEINFLIHPGKHLKEFIESKGMSQANLAKETKFSEKHISRVINGKQGITAQFALRLFQVFPEIKATFWMKLQSNYDLERLSSIATNIKGQE